MYDSKNIAYVLTSLEEIEKLLIYTEGIQSTKGFLERDDQLVYNACLTLLMTISKRSSILNDKLITRYEKYKSHQSLIRTSYNFSLAVFAKLVRSRKSYSNIQRYK